MLLQIPVFIGLYWVIVRLRRIAPWHFGWAGLPTPAAPTPPRSAHHYGGNDVRPNLSEPAADQTRCRRNTMKIMPLVFRHVLSSFPAGLVLYWVVNNLLTIAQHSINRSIEKQRAHRQSFPKCRSEKCRLKPVQTAFLLPTPYRGGNLQPAYITKSSGVFSDWAFLFFFATARFA